MSDLEIRLLDESDAPEVSRLLTSDPPEHSRYFRPFDTDVASVSHVLAAAEEDRFWGLIAGEGALGGLVMLRGLDAGFTAPAFGVYVAARLRRMGLGTLALAFAQTWCRVNGIAEIMLTVDPDNADARRIYERDGFVSRGERSPIGHLVYRKSFGDD